MIRRLPLAALAAVTFALATVVTPATTSASPAQESGTAGATTVTLLSQPIAVAPDGSFPVFLGVEDAPDATTIVVDIYDEAAPSEIIGTEPDAGPVATFPPFLLPGPAEAGAPRTALFSIELYAEGQPTPDPAWGWEINEPGVYPVRVRLQDPNGNRLATLMTSLIRLPEAGQEVDETGAALLVPVHRPPPADPAVRAGTDTADASLLRDLDPILAALRNRPDLPATFSATPDTVARIAGDADAAQELIELRTELDRGGRFLLDAPYVNLDVASLTESGIGELISPEAELGRQTLSDLLEPPLAGTWQLHARVDPASLAQLRNRGVVRALLPGDALASGAGVQAPVDLPAAGGTVRAVTVSGAYALGLQAADDPVLSAHRLLGRLAAAGPGPTGTSNIIVSIDPGAVAPESLAIVADALSFNLPFFSATTADAVLDAPAATASASLATPAPVALGTYPADVQRSQSSLASYESMVAGRTELTRSYGLTLAVSAAADLDLTERVRDARSVDEDLQVPFNAVSMPTKDKVTLGARDATFPLPIESSLDYDVKVVIELEANDRIDLPSNRIEETLEPGRNRIKIRVRTRTTGDTPIRITVRSPDDGVTLAESQYTVRSTAVSGVGIVLTVGAAAFLALWWGRHWIRNRDSARHAKHRSLRRKDHDTPV